MNSSSPNIHIIGAGVSGLIAAIELEKAGHHPVIIEQTDRVGGRVKTDTIDGIPFDHGFQVLLTQYPAAQRYLDFDALQLKKFAPGAVIYRAGQATKIGDPLRDTSFLWSTAFSSVGSIRDKIKILRLANQLKKQSIESIFQQKEISTLAFLQQFGFSQKIIDNFFRPFFSGIFLEPKLASSQRMFQFVYKLFSEGHAAIPQKGMQAISDQLKGQLQQTTFHFNTKVKAIDGQQIQLADGRQLTSDCTIIATDPTAILQQQHSAIHWQGCSNLYFKTTQSTLQQSIIGLITDEEALVNNFHFISDVHALPKQSVVLSATVVKEHQLEEAALIEKVVNDLQKYARIENLELLKLYHIPKSLPHISDLKYQPAAASTLLADNIILAGDHLANGSLNAAMESGRVAAETVLKLQTISI